MAGVKPVEYKKDSSTVGFAVAGDKKEITKTNANTISKDVKQGNTKDLESGQEKYLESQVDEDNIDYTDDELKNVGKNQINTDDTENSNGLKTTGSMLASGAGTAIMNSEAAVAPIATGAADISTYAAQTGQAAKTAKIPWMAIVAGAIDLGIGTVALVAVNAFDDQYNDRMSQLNAAGDTNNIIQQYYDQMTADMDTMTEDAKTYADLSDQKLTADIDRATQIGALQAQILVYQAQGNEEMVTQLNAQIAELTKQGDADKTGDQINELQKGLETYSGNNAEAMGVGDSGSTVAEFLSDGTQMGILGTINSALLLLSGINMLQATFDAAKAATKVPWPGNIAAGIVAIAGAAMMTAGNVMVLAAAVKMGMKTKDEFKCADAGSEMQENVNNLLANAEQQGGFTETTGAEYAAIVAENTKTLQKNQEAIDKANQNVQVPPSQPKAAGSEGNPDNPEDNPNVNPEGEAA